MVFFSVTYKIFNLPLELCTDIMVNVSDIENLNWEKDIKIINKIGNINEKEFFNIAKTCSKGLDFFKSFEKCIEQYLNIREKRKKFTKNKNN